MDNVAHDTELHTLQCMNPSVVLASTNNLFHETLLAITIGILRWVKLVHQRWLSVLSRSVMIVSTSVLSSREVIRRGMARCARVNTTGDTTKGTVDVLWLPSELIMRLSTTSQRTTMLLERADVHRREGGCSMVLWCVVNLLVHRNNGVCDVRLDGLLVDHRLNRLVDMVMDVFTSDLGQSCTLGVSGWCADGFVLKLCCCVFEVVLDVVVVAVVNCAVLGADDVLVVLGGKDFAVLHWLD